MKTTRKSHATQSAPAAAKHAAAAASATPAKKGGGSSQFAEHETKGRAATTLVPPALTKPYSANAGKTLRADINERRVQAMYGPFVADADFLTKLAQTPTQAKALTALTHNDEFKALWSWFTHFPGGNPIRMVIQPGLKMDGKERFGGFMGGDLTLVVNPAKAEHVENPQELVNTVVHELVHASLDVAEEAKRMRLNIPPAPLPDGATDLYRDRNLSTLHVQPNVEKAYYEKKPAAREYMRREYGDSDSSPTDEYIDVNRTTQHLVQRIVAANIKETGVGHPTITGLDLPERLASA